MSGSVDWAARRALFPALREWSYFGWASVAPLSTPAVQAMQDHLAGVRDQGVTQYREWYATYERARATAARLIGARRASEISLLKNTSEGVSTAAFGLDWKAGDNLILPRGEFPANAYPWLALRERGVEIRRVEPDQTGAYRPEEVARLMDGRTRALSVSFVNFVTGFRADLAALGRLCRPRGIFFFVDAIQGLGALPLDVEAMQIDALAADGHKWLCGPEGQALFFVRGEWQERIRPLSLGWWSAEHPGRYDLEDQPLSRTARRFECGTLTTVAVYGLQAALSLIEETGVAQVAERIESLSGRMVEELRRRGHAILRAEEADSRSGIFSFEIPCQDSRALAERLETRKILVNVRGGRLRLAVHAWNDENDIQRLVEALP